MPTQVEFSPLRPDLPFGTRVSGATRENLENPATRSAIEQAFERDGLLVFEEVEQSSQMQLAISRVLGPLKDHPVAAVNRADSDLAPGVIDLNSNLDDQVIVEIDGKPFSNWLPWHFDHAYNDELNRAGVLRPIDIAPKGGLTGFVDGIDLYRSLPPELRQQIDGAKVLYHLGVIVLNMRFGKPAGFRGLRNSTEGVKCRDRGEKGAARDPSGGVDPQYRRKGLACRHVARSGHRRP